MKVILKGSLKVILNAMLKEMFKGNVEWKCKGISDGNLTGGIGSGARLEQSGGATHIAPPLEVR